ncbi:vWA domain-containing protein [Rubinisphaera margarita]|uniref:vWA domain-containing protein n=1 Tax=Rubinisphaera margarita TaxID=2909586 RepID=UPI001EE7A2BF|nr:hypothetical protein [Rubinisphaera margarita]MCG6154275.1 hypothetical protein [Rubinisphaera margarita]
MSTTAADHIHHHQSGRLLPWSSAVVAHAVLLALCGLIGWSSPGTHNISSIQSEWTQLENLSRPEPLDLEVETEIPIAEHDGRSNALDSSTASSSRMFTEPVVSPLEPVLFAERPRPVSPVELVEYAEVSTHTLEGLLHLARMGSGIDRAGAGQGAFLGKATRAIDRRIAYVVDASASMNHKHDSAAGTRFGRVKVELLHSIESLQPDQEFCVYFFNDGPESMPPGHSVFRGQKSPMELYRWIAEFRARGTTKPLPALEAAIREQPDLIYFLTDGAISKRDLEKASVLNRHRARICTICIGVATSEQQLRFLSEENGGTFTFVP